jgi:hypothetical protein
METVDDLLDSIFKARKRIGITNFPAWYRGHSDVQHKLLPSLLRYKTGLRHERNLMAIFKTRGANFLPESVQSSWDTLAIMQHHGTPTRLLDWTESVDVALFFAVSQKCSNPTIWILNPFRLNFASIGKNLVFDRADLIFYDYYKEIVEHRCVPHEYPIAIHAPWITPRIVNQKGCFTIHGSDPRPIEDQPGRFIKKVVIPQHLVGDLRKYLRNRQIDDFELFPDLDGLSRSLKSKFRFV